MADTQSTLTPEQIAQEIVAQAEASGSNASQQLNPTAQSLNLPAGQNTQTVFNINSFDPRFPTGFITIVTDKNDNPVGYVKDGKVANLLEPGYSLAEIEAQKKGKESSENKASESTKNAQLGSFNYAQILQQTAADEYQQLETAARQVAQGNALPSQKDDLERAAKEYASTMVAIKSAYQKAGVVNGPINLDPTTGKLATGTTYTDPTTKQAVVAGKSNATPQVRYDANGNSLVPGTPEYEKGFITRPPESNITGTFGSGSIETQTSAAGTGAGSNKGTNGGSNTDGSGTGGKSLPGFTTQKGLLYSNGVAYTGEKDGKYYNNGKEETTAEVKADFEAKYGMAASFLASVPELGGSGVNGQPSLLDQAIAGNWSADRFKQAYMQSTWYQTNGATYAQEEQDRLSSPGTYAANYNNLLKEMVLQAQAQGIDISNLGGPITSDQAKTMDPNTNPVAKLLQSYYGAPVPSDILSTFIAKSGQVAKSAQGSLQGSLATTATSLKNYASQMGVASQYLNPTWSNAAGQSTTGQDYFTSAAQAIQQGLTTSDSVQANMRSVAANIYKPFAQQINDGYSVSDLAQPYTSTVANLLEVSPTSVDLGATTGYGSMVTKALQGDGTNPMSLDQFTSQVKSRPEWLNTTNARNSLMDTATSLLRNFGLVVGG